MKSLEELEAALDQPQVGLGDLDHANSKRRRAALDAVVALPRRYAGLVKPLLARLEVEANEYVLSRALTAVGAVCPTGEATPAGVAVAKCLGHPDARVVANAVDALRGLRDTAHVAAVQKLAGHASARVRASACVYLATTGPAGYDAAAAIRALITARDFPTRRSGFWALEQIAPDAPPAWASVDAIQLVQQAMRAGDPELTERIHARLRHWAAQGSAPARAAVLALTEAAAREGAGGDGDRAAAAALGDVAAPNLTKRALAWLADSVVLGLLALGALALLGSRDVDPRAFRVKTQLVMLGYSLVFFMRDGLGGGRGLFKRYLGLRVMERETGAGCGYVSSMIRQATFYLPLVNLCEVAWASIDPEGCRLVDRLLGTVVIDERHRPLSALDRALLAVCGLAFAAGSGVVILMAFAGDLGLLKRWIVW